MSQVENCIESQVNQRTMVDIIPNYKAFLSKKQVRFMWALYVLSVAHPVSTIEDVLLTVEERFKKRYTKNCLPYYFARSKCGGNELVVGVETATGVAYCLSLLGGDFILAVINDKNEGEKFLQKSSTPNIV